VCSLFERIGWTRSVQEERLAVKGLRSVVFNAGGREIYDRGLEEIRELTRLCGGLSREELAHTVCEHLSWLTASGRHKIDACKKLLEKLEEEGAIALPAKRVRKPSLQVINSQNSRTAPRAAVCGELSEVEGVTLRIACGTGDKALWNEYVDRYHMLGYKRPFGCRIRYFIVSPKGELGCILLAGAAKSMGARDEWIGWSDKIRLKNLPWIVNNTRFLIFPWVRVSHLASHALGQLARRARDDWYERFGYRPLMMETFVDPAHYRGTCYRAAGWTYLGKTTGEGLRRPGREYKTTPKMLFVKPLTEDFREQLCSELKGRKAVE
jgi:hypothetical protein